MTNALLTKRCPQAAAKRLSSLWIPPELHFHKPACFKTLRKRMGQSPALLIRHANSYANAVANEVLKEAKASPGGKGLPLERWLEAYGREDLIDSRLDDKGIEQCLLAAPHMNQIDFRVMVVSPMRRTLETCYYMFNQHPNWKDMKFVLHPLLREKIGISGDVPLCNERFKYEMEHMYQPMYGGRLDTRFMDHLLARDEPWYMDSLHASTMEPLRALVREKGLSPTEAVFETIMETFPVKFESVLNIKQRCDDFREDLYELVEETDGVGMVAKQGKIGVVGHSVYYRVYNAKQEYWTDKYHPVTWDHYPDSDMSHQLMNCEVYPDKTILHEQQSDINEFLQRIFLWKGIPPVNLV